MRHEEIKKGNKLIDIFYYGKEKGELYDGLNHYHKDWNLLMPVVEKLEWLGYYVSVIGRDCLVTDERRSLISHCQSFKNKKESVYNAVVSAIEWYNLQTPSK